MKKLNILILLCFLTSCKGIVVYNFKDLVGLGLVGLILLVVLVVYLIGKWENFMYRIRKKKKI